MMKQQLFDLHECYSATTVINGKSKRVERHISTIAYNTPYAILRRKKQVLESDKRYPSGTFFVITENGKQPELNKFATLKSVKLHTVPRRQS